MPLHNQPSRLVTLAEKVLYYSIVCKIVDTADDDYTKCLRQRDITKKLKLLVGNYDKTVTTTPFGKNLETLPARFLTESMNEMITGLIAFLKVDDIEDYLDDKPSSFKEKFIRVLFVILNYLLSYKVTDLNFNIIGTEYTLYVAKHFTVMKEFDKSALNQAKHEIFLKGVIFDDTIALFKNNLGYLTSVSLQNMASSKLLWTVCCSCPNLQHLDIGGSFFAIPRFIGFEDEFLAEFQPIAKKNINIYNFVRTLCAIYGRPTIEHMKDEVQPRLLEKLKTLKIPALWNEAEAKDVATHMKRVLLDCQQLQEVEGVDIFRALHLMTNSEIESHSVLTLRKIVLQDHADTYDAKPLLKKFRLPWVVDVNINLNESTGPEVLLNFPNLRHLKVQPQGPYVYTLNELFPYLRNLHTLDIDFMKPVIISDICQIGEGCRSLTSLTVRCSIFLMTTEEDKEGRGGYQKLIKQQLWDNEVLPVPPEFDPKDVENMGYWNARLASQDGLWLMDDIDPVWYEIDSNQIPKLERLHTLRIADYKLADPAAIYKCIKGSPNIQTLSIKAYQNRLKFSYEPFDDFLVFRIAKILKRVKEVRLEFPCKDRKYEKLKRLTCRAVHYLINYCDCIETIGCLEYWNISNDEVLRLNRSFKEQNFIVKLKMNETYFKNTISYSFIY